jgi:hypothetical protein
MSRNRPAFPGTPATPEWREGMTLRDYFAAKAMQGLVNTFKGDVSSSYDIIAIVSYKMADEMLKQRQQ